MKLTLIALFFISLSSYAEIFEVHSAAKKESRPGHWIVKFMDGRVGFWDEENDPTLKPSSLRRSIIDADLSETHILTSVRIIAPLDEAPSFSQEKILPAPSYTPTIYSSYNFATDVLSGMRRSWTENSQCYDRSHIWAYEEAYAGRHLQKAFLFFSDAYIGRYDFPWWFHTAPYALVRLRGEVVERVMDPAFSRYPLKMKLWTDLFMRNKAECKLIDKYSGYAQHPGEDDCYLIKTSRYFWQPKDLDAFERSGVLKTRFIDWEVRHAYQNGFGIRQ